MPNLASLVTMSSQAGYSIETLIIQAYPDAPASSTRPVYSSLRFRQRGILRLGSHTPEVVVNFLSRHIPCSSCIPTHFVEVEHQIQLTHVSKERIENLHEEVDSLEICQFIIVRIDARAKEEACVSAVNDLGHVAELDKVGLVFLVAWSYEAVDLG